MYAFKLSDVISSFVKRLLVAIGFNVRTQSRWWLVQWSGSRRDGGVLKLFATSENYLHQCTWMTIETWQWTQRLHSAYKVQEFGLSGFWKKWRGYSHIESPSFHGQTSLHKWVLMVDPERIPSLDSAERQALLCMQPLDTELGQSTERLCFQFTEWRGLKSASFRFTKGDCTIEGLR